MHARALAQGRSYTDIGFLHSPYTALIAPVAEPPGLPALIAPIFVTVGESLTWARALLVVSVLLFAWAVGHYWSRAAGAVTALIVAAWSVIALMRLHVVDTVLADVPFAAAVWLAFAIADAPEGVRDTRRAALLALAGMLAFSFRMAALPLLPALATWALLRPREERPRLALAGVCWALTAIAVLFVLPGASVVGGEVARPPAVVLRDVALNARAALDGLRDWVPVDVPWKAMNLLFHGSLLLVASVGTLIALREAPRRFAFITAVWYVLMLAALPGRAGRYVWVLFPFLTFGLIRALRDVTERMRPSLGASLRRLAPAAVVVLLTAGVVEDFGAEAPRTLRSEPDAQEILAALTREDGSGATPVRAVFFSPRVLAWETGITATAFSGATPDAMYSEIRRLGITHVVVGDAGTGAPGTDETAEMVAAHPEAFVPMIENRDFALYAVRRIR